jgi:hypothetical protein
MKRSNMNNSDSKRVFANTWDNGRNRPLPMRGGYRL